MAGRWEVGPPKKTNASSLKEQATRTILRNVRSQGHTYVEVREDGKKLIFFCTLCLAPCYSDKVLFDHLKGNLHNERLAAAKVTLLRPNPWPFNDGVVFFDNSKDIDKPSVNPEDSKCRMWESHGDMNDLAIVKYGENLKTNGYDHCDADGLGCNEYMDSDVGVKSSGGNSRVLIPGVVVRDEITDIEVTEVGVGEIAARLLGKDSIGRIWCEWLGEKGTDSDKFSKVPEHGFAVVTFSYNIDLGRKGLLDNVRMLLAATPTIESENSEGTSCKRKKSFSDPGDVSDSPSNQYDSFGEDSSSSGTVSKLLLDRYDDQLLNTRFILNKSTRRELRRQQRLASGRMCDICQQRMLPGKDVATLLNVKTGKLACSSRNVNGAFHVFHISCLIHWILLCEVEMITNQSAGSKGRRRSKRKTSAKWNGKDAQLTSVSPQVNSEFCPECQGTGIVVDGDDLEKPNLPLSQMFKYKIKVSDARRAWMKSPELLQNCSTGFHFPSAYEEEGIQEKVKTLKLLHFYRAHE